MGKYVLREADFWTCGFFPGTIYALLERVMKYPQALNWSNPEQKRPHHVKNQPEDVPVLSRYLLSLCRVWSEPLHAMAKRTDTHDIGFIIEPALRADWELTGNRRSLLSLITAARSLATRYDPRIEAIRSWDLINKKDVEITSMEENFIVIIDSLCNLDLLFYSSTHLADDTLAAIARSHARTLLRTHLRLEPALTTSAIGYKGQMYSTCHVVNLDPKTGEVKQRLTAQGYAAGSTWARGQAWAILGYTQTYMWTKEWIFLETACGLAEYFLYRLDTAPTCVDVQQSAHESHERTTQSKGQPRTSGCNIPPWDFDAPVDPKNPIQDSSAGAIAANGMLLLSQALAAAQQHSLSRRFRDAAIDVVKDLLTFSLAEEKARFVFDGNEHGLSADGIGFTVEDVELGHSFDAVLKNATANNNVGARRRYWNHGLVYGDYYLVQFGNQLLTMGLA
jgi:hypothetical protein